MTAVRFPERRSKAFSRRPFAQLSLWRDGQLERVIPLGSFRPLEPVEGHRFGELVRFSPDGSEPAVGFPDAGAATEHTGSELVLLDLLSNDSVVVRVDDFAWSPDGTWLAASTDAGISIRGALPSEVVYSLPLRARSSDWR